MKTVVVFVLVAALLCGCAATVQPGIPYTSSGTATIVLKTDIDTYSPLMSSAFGIHIFATDRNGNAVTGDWTATWGQFCTASPTADGWNVGEGQPEWRGASNIWWQFSPDPTPNGEMPSSVGITFTGGGSTQALLLEKSGPMTLKVANGP